MFVFLFVCVFFLHTAVSRVCTEWYEKKNKRKCQIFIYKRGQRRIDRLDGTVRKARQYNGRR